MTPQDFDYLRQLLRQRSGLVLSAEKQYLAESRLLPVARKHGLGNLAERGSIWPSNRTRSQTSPRSSST